MATTQNYKFPYKAALLLILIIMTFVSLFAAVITWSLLALSSSFIFAGELIGIVARKRWAQALIYIISSIAILNALVAFLIGKPSVGATIAICVNIALILLAYMESRRSLEN